MADKSGIALSDKDIEELTALRRLVHSYPELSGEEEQTAARVAEMLEATAPTQIIRGLGGHGVAAIYDSHIAGPRVLLRCELDGLPIEDLAGIAHRSKVSGKGHQCGHDGHMAMLLGVARLLGRQSPARGAVILMFQPAEEDGSGARKVVSDPAFVELQADYAFAIHNMPGRPFGEVDIIDGPFSCASRGMKLRLTGKTAHASQPETGISPMRAISTLMPQLTAMASEAGIGLNDPDFRLITITHASMGAPAFGVAPGQAEIFATLRTLTDSAMTQLVQRVEALVNEVAERDGLGVDISYSDIFDMCENHPAASDIVRSALDRLGIAHSVGMLPMRASEDFGCFGAHAKAAMLLLGSGIDLPALHNPDFDFPDQLIPLGPRIFLGIIEELMRCA